MNCDKIKDKKVLRRPATDPITSCIFKGLEGVGPHSAMPCPSQTMSLTVQQILTDAKRLVTRLREHDNTADNLISQTEALSKKVAAMKQYDEDINELNEVAGQRPRSALVLGIQQENRHIRELQQENKELRLLLEEQQSALELIMSKYREQMVQLVLANKAERNTRVQPDNGNAWLLQSQADKIYEMAAVMARAIVIDNEAIAVEQEVHTRLATENKGLREMLEIGTRAGSVRPMSEMVDKEIQTDS